MTFWFIAGSLQEALEDKGYVYYPAACVPNLARALSRDHLREWIKQLRLEATPEAIDEETDRLWKPFSELHPEDTVIVQRNSAMFSLGEVTGSYRFEQDDGGGRHVWPVRWIAHDISFAHYPTLRALADSRIIKEVPEEETRIKLRKHLPSSRTKSYVVFRWVSVVILVAELVYFWPH